MRGRLGWLTALALLQCAVVAWLYWPDGEPLGPGPTLVQLEPATVERLQIGDEYDNEAVLLRSGERWVLPALANLPADAAMVEALLAAMRDPAGNWPVAHTLAARQRFQVANSHYQRRLDLFTGDRLPATLFLGTAPGFGKVHARNAEQDAIYTIGLNLFDAPATDAAWLDRRLLQIRTPVGITADSYSLVRAGTAWHSGMGNVPDERELQALLTALRSLLVEGVADQDTQRELAVAEAELVLAVDSLAGQVTLELFRLGGRYYILSSEFPLCFTLDAYNFERLVNIDFRLISGVSEPTPTAP